MGGTRGKAQGKVRWVSARGWAFSGKEKVPVRPFNGNINVRG